MPLTRQPIGDKPPPPSLSLPLAPSPRRHLEVDDHELVLGVDPGEVGEGLGSRPVRRVHPPEVRVVLHVVRRVHVRLAVQQLGPGGGGR